MHDIIIIGAGVSGCACAQELSRYDAKILVVEKGGGRLLRRPRPTAPLSTLGTTRPTAA